MKKILLAIAPVAFLSLSSCSKDKIPEPVNEEEVITTLTMTFTPQTGESNVVWRWRDTDGDGGSVPEITSPALATNTNYELSITLLNETESPAENVTEEIEEEDDEHQFFLEKSNGLNATFTYDDKDDDGNPVGLSWEFNAASASTGTLKITLRHKPNKTAADVASGDITNAGGETDIEVTFNATIQ